MTDLLDALRALAEWLSPLLAVLAIYGVLLVLTRKNKGRRDPPPGD